MKNELKMGDRVVFVENYGNDIEKGDRGFIKEIINLFTGEVLLTVDVCNKRRTQAYSYRVAIDIDYVIEKAVKEILDEKN